MIFFFSFRQKNLNQHGRISALLAGPHPRPSVPRLPRGFPGIPVLNFTHLDDFLANAFAKKALTANSGLGLQFLLVYYAALFKEYYGNRIHPIKRPGCLEI